MHRLRALSFVLALSLSLSTIASCGKSQPPTSSPTTSQTTSTTASSPQSTANKTSSHRSAGVPVTGDHSSDSHAVDGDGENQLIAATGAPLAAKTEKGLAWLVAHQLPSGGWGQGDESPQMQASNQAQLRDTANVADTAMALLALMRSGSTPKTGQYQQAVTRGLNFIFGQIEAADEESLYVTDSRGTRVQSKIGTYVDTFTSLIVLTEAKGHMASSADNARLERAMAKVLRKIERNQRNDGTWDNAGWAPVLTQSLAAKGLNRAAQAGEPVDDAVLERVEAEARGKFDADTGNFATTGSAGIGLYGGAAASAALRDSVTTRKVKEKKVREQLAQAKDQRQREEAEQQLAANKQAEAVTASAEQALLERLDDPAFIQGFGNNGGEEFLSYMLVSEALFAKGGQDWDTWNGKITALMHRVQNGDGSWTGHHCITGRTFCTAAALLVLMADRAPVPIAAQIRKG